MTRDELVPIYWPADLLEGDAIGQALQSEGIACHLEGENPVAGYPDIGRANRMRLLVQSKDAERAKRIIDEGEGQWPTYT